MATHATLSSLFSDIADAIRSVNNTPRNIIADSFPSEILKLGESWAGFLTFSGTYATPTYFTEDGCFLAVDKQKGMAFVTIQGGTSKSYENIIFSVGSFPDGVALLTPQTYTHASNSIGTYYTAVLTGITGKIGVSVSLDSVNSSYDYVMAALTVITYDTYDITITYMAGTEPEIVSLVPTDVATWADVINQNSMFTQDGDYVKFHNQILLDFNMENAIKTTDFVVSGDYYTEDVANSL